MVLIISRVFYPAIPASARTVICMWRQFADRDPIWAVQRNLHIHVRRSSMKATRLPGTAENALMEPVGSTNLYFTLDQDGVPCSADYILRLTGDGDKMLKAQIAFTFTRPTVPMLAACVSHRADKFDRCRRQRAGHLLNWSPVTGAADVSTLQRKERAVGERVEVILSLPLQRGLVGFTDTSADQPARTIIMSSSRCEFAWRKFQFPRRQRHAADHLRP